MAKNLTGLTRIFNGSRKAIKHYGLKSNWMLWNFERQYSSALYISGKKGNTDFAYLTPYLDFDKRFLDIDKLQKDLDLRQIKVDVKNLKDMWEFYKKLNAQKSDLEGKATDLGKQMQELYGAELTKAQEQELNKLQIQLKILKKDIKGIKNILWELDSTVIEELLKLPNEIDSRTPIDSSVVLKQFGTLNPVPERDAKSHIEIGRNLGLLVYKNPMQCYLCNDAALFELGVLGFAGKILNENDMIRVAGSDFSRSLVVEGSGLNHENPLDAFIIHNHSEIKRGSSNRMHLVGGASLISFLAMHAKQLVNPNHFPLRYFATGRQYTPFPEGAIPIGLFTICQSSAVHAFVVVRDINGPEYNIEFDKLVNSVCKLYDNLCDHYRVVKRPVSELRPWEGLRVSFELWSPFTKQYIEVGHISVCGEYFSKRLLIAYQTPTGRGFPAIISGTVLSVPRLLGCLLEQNPTKFVSPPQIAKHIPADYVSL